MSSAHRLVHDVSHLVHDFEKYDFPEESNLEVTSGGLDPASAIATDVVVATKNGDSEGSVLPDYLPEKTAVKSVRDLYPAVMGKLFSDILLPSKGKKPDNCQEWTPVFFCPSCGRPHFSRGDCGKSTCPDCEVGWRFDRCQSIMERVLSLKIQRGKRCRHFVVSPEVEDYPENIEELKELRKQAYQFACGSEDFHEYDFEGKGVEGGVVLFHPFRILPEKKSELWGEIDEDNNEFKLWKKLLEKDFDDILRFVYWAPHFHIIGVGEKGDNTFDEGKESDIFNFVGLGELSEASDIGRCSMYLLSHLGVFEKSHFNSIVWFGSLSSSKWSLGRAKMRLKNGSTVRDFTLDLVEDFIGNEHEELNGSLECDNCGAGLLHISSALDYLEDDDVDFEFEAELRVAYSWWRGSIPPPEGLESESDCWDYLEKLVFEQSEESRFVSDLAGGLDSPDSFEGSLESVNGHDYSIPIMRVGNLAGGFDDSVGEVEDLE